MSLFHQHSWTRLFKNVNIHRDLTLRRIHYYFAKLLANNFMRVTLVSSRSRIANFSALLRYSSFAALLEELQLSRAACEIARYRDLWFRTSLISTHSRAPARPRLERIVVRASRVECIGCATGAQSLSSSIARFNFALFLDALAHERMYECVHTRRRRRTLICSR